jgi:nucleotide-binding universal stress UspA family protein
LYRKVLIAFDGSDDSRFALNEGAELATLYKAEVVLVSVIGEGSDFAAAEAYASGSADQEQLDETRAMLAEEVARLGERGLAGTAAVAFGHPAEALAAQARESGADLVVIGHRTHGLWSRLANDAVGVRLVKDPPCSVLIIPPRN